MAQDEIQSMSIVFGALCLIIALLLAVYAYGYLRAHRRTGLRWYLLGGLGGVAMVLVMGLLAASMILMPTRVEQGLRVEHALRVGQALALLRLAGIAGAAGIELICLGLGFIIYSEHRDVCEYENAIKTSGRKGWQGIIARLTTNGPRLDRAARTNLPAPLLPTVVWGIIIGGFCVCWGYGLYLGGPLLMRQATGPALGALNSVLLILLALWRHWRLRKSGGAAS